MPKSEAELDHHSKFLRRSVTFMPTRGPTVLRMLVELVTLVACAVVFFGLVAVLR